MKAMLWRTSPASTELEDVTLDWLRQMLGLPDEFEGIIYDTASVSTMHAIAAAREKANLKIRDDGMSGRTDLPLMRVYCSEHVHSSIDKSAITLGLGLRSPGIAPLRRAERLAEAFRASGRPHRNAGALCGSLCLDVPVLVHRDILGGRLKIDEVSTTLFDAMGDRAQAMYSPEADGQLKGDTLYLPATFDMDNLADLGASYPLPSLHFRLGWML